MWKSKADKPTMTKMSLRFAFDLEIDSALSDKELPNEITRLIKERLTGDGVSAVVTRVERDGDGYILSLSVEFVTPIVDQNCQRPA